MRLPRDMTDLSDLVTHQTRLTEISYSALLSNAFDPMQSPTSRLIAVTPAMRLTDALRDVVDTARLAAQRFAGWPIDFVRRKEFFAVFDGERSNLSTDERNRRMVRLASEVAGHGNNQSADRFALPTFVAAGAPKGIPATMAELPPDYIAALLAVRRAPSLIILSAALGFSQTINLGVHLYAAAIAYHSVHLGLANDPGTVTEKLALAAGAQRIVSQWDFVQVRLNGVPTYAIGLK